MKSANIEIDSLDILQELFGINDKLIRVIENRLGVSITQRNSCITISGTNDGRIRSAVNIIKAMQEALGKQQQLSVDMIHRFLDETEEEDDNEDGIADSTRRVLGDAVTLNYKNIPIRTKTIGQKNYITALKNNTVTIWIGPAGTGKTYLAVAYAAELYRNDEIERIILSRPAIEAGEKLGFLPGDLQEKVDPYLKPLYDALNDVFGPDQAAKLRERGIIEVAPLAYMRGRTLNNSMIIIDESQNATLPILKMALTRIGTGSKMILTGDVTQIDLTEGKRSGLTEATRILSGIEGIGQITLTNKDVVRHPLVQKIVKAYDEYESAQQRKEKNARQNKKESRGRRNDN